MATENYYNSESALKSPFQLIRSILSDLPRTINLGARLFLRDFKSQHREAIMGLAWAVLPVLLLAGIFIGAANAEILNVQSTIPYAAFVIIGTVLWQTFVESLNAPIIGLEKNKSLISKIKFPTESIVVAKMLDVLFNFCLKLILLFGVIWYYDFPITMKLLFFPLGVLSIMLIGLTIGVFLSPLALMFQDVSRGLQLILPGLMFLSPVVYQLPESGFLGFFSRINPLSTLFDFTRNMLVGGPMDIWPKWAITCLLSVFFLGISWLFLRISIPTVNERTGN